MANCSCCNKEVADEHSQEEQNKVIFCDDCERLWDLLQMD